MKKKLLLAPLFVALSIFSCARGGGVSQEYSSSSAYDSSLSTSGFYDGVKVIYEGSDVECELSEDDIAMMAVSFKNSAYIPEWVFDDGNPEPLHIEKIYYYGTCLGYEIVQFAYFPVEWSYLLDGVINISFSPCLAYDSSSQEMISIPELYESKVLSDSEMEIYGKYGYCKNVSYDGGTITYDVLVKTKYAPEESSKLIFDIYGNQYHWFGDNLQGEFLNLSAQIVDFHYGYGESYGDSVDVVNHRFNNKETVLPNPNYLVGIAQSYLHFTKQNGETLVHIQYYGSGPTTIYVSVWSENDVFEGPYNESLGSYVFSNSDGHRLYAWRIGLYKINS